jgi:uncharacterized OB-fold protein
MDTVSDFPIPDLSYEPLKPFWAAAAERRLEIPKCASCGHFNWYPKPVCAHCESQHFNWTQLNGKARIFSWASVRRALHAPYKSIAPYVSVIVEFDEAPGVRLVSRWIGPDVLDLAIGNEVSIVFEDLGHPNIQTRILAPLIAYTKSH